MTLIEMKAALERLQAESAETKSKLVAVEAEFATLKAESSKLKTDKQAAEQAATHAQEAEAKAKADNATLSNENAALKAKADKLEADAKSASQRAVDIAAQAGHAPVAGEQEAKAESTEDLHKQFAAIRDNRERAAFYEKHKDKLLK